MKRTLILTMLFAVPVLLFAAGVTGTWKAQVQVGDQKGSPSFMLKQHGQQLTGTYSGVLGQAPITGTVKGTNITLNFESSGTKVTYSGKVLPGGKKMEGTVNYGGAATGTFTALKEESTPNKK